MNQVNVNSLTALLMAIDLRVNDGQPLEAWASDIAYQLAERGCLVPAALTDEDCRHVAAVAQAFTAMSQSSGANFDRAVAAKLERIAKGEPA